MTLLNFTSFSKVAMLLHLTEDAALSWVPYQHHLFYNLSGWLLCMFIVLCFSATWHTCILLFPHVKLHVLYQQVVILYLASQVSTGTSRKMSNTHIQHLACKLKTDMYRHGIQSSECSKSEVHVCLCVCIWYALTLAGRHLSTIGYFQSLSQKKMRRLTRAGCPAWTLDQCHVTRSNTEHCATILTLLQH